VSGVKKKPRNTYCVFNKTRETFISLNLTVADTHLTRLRGLLGKVRMKPDEGIWIIPSYGVHTLGLPFSVDLIYLDAEYRVIKLIESLGSFRISPVRLKCLTVLELANRAIYSSQTQVGDQLLICPPEEMAEFLKNSRTEQLKAASA
jgi:uncharacterized membrane protein (UPF0127 family)